MNLAFPAVRFNQSQTVFFNHFAYQSLIFVASNSEFQKNRQNFYTKIPSANTAHVTRKAKRKIFHYRIFFHVVISSKTSG